MKNFFCKSKYHEVSISECDECFRNGFSGYSNQRICKGKNLIIASDDHRKLEKEEKNNAIL